MVRSLFISAIVLILCACQEEKGVQPEVERALPVKVCDQQAQPGQSVYTEFFREHLVRPEASGFVKVEPLEEPQQYYLFYLTASFCTPCHAFSPTLVSFYEMYKEIYGDRFEFILVSADRDEQQMLTYSLKKGMKWPHIEAGALALFREEFQLPGRLIPNVVVTDREGNVLKSSYDREGLYHGPEIPMNHLKNLLAQ